MVITLNVDTGNVVHQLMGHVDEVQGLTWSNPLLRCAAQLPTYTCYIHCVHCSSTASEQSDDSKDNNNNDSHQDENNNSADMQTPPQDTSVDTEVNGIETLSYSNYYILIFLAVGNNEQGTLQKQQTIHTVSSNATGIVFLATSSRDKTVRVWNGRDGTLIQVFQLPKSSIHGTDPQKGRVWATVTWSPFQPYHLIASSYMYVATVV
jgi:WD40 repeat protein